MLCGDRAVAWEVLELAIGVCSDTYGAVHELINKGDDNSEPNEQQPPSSVDPSAGYYIWPPYHVDLIKGMTNARREYRFLDARNVTNALGTPRSFARADSAPARLTLSIIRDCFLAHDKIFSVLGILPAQLRDAIELDYSVPARTVFRRAVRACVETTG